MSDLAQTTRKYGSKTNVKSIEPINLGNKPKECVENTEIRKLIQPPTILTFFKKRIAPSSITKKRQRLKSTPSEEKDFFIKEEAKFAGNSGLKSVLQQKSSASIDKPALHTKVQSFLDFGQREFGTRTCPKCEMVYSFGTEQDENQHKKFCRSQQAGIVFAGWKSERVVWSQIETNAYRIVQIRACDHPSHLQKAEEIVRFLCDNLGSYQNGKLVPKRNSENSQTEILQTSFHEDEKQSKVQDNPVDWSSQQVFILVKDRCVIGAVLAEAVTRAFRRIVPTEEMTDNLDELNVSDCMLLDKNHPEHAQVGIVLLWISPNHRRKGCATWLIDAVKNNFHYAMEIDRQNVAFCQPTFAGAVFAEKYSGLKNFLAY